jgi:phospholipid/cholesterol/gamma-HCH transport system ATP-binding protein
MATSPKIELRDLHKSFGPKVVLAGLDLEVEAGQSLVVIGGSGTGKSVLLKHVIGLLRPDKGTVRVDGIDLSTLGERQITEFRRRFGMAFQEGALFDSMTVGENVSFALRRFTGWTPTAIRDRVRECLKLVRLEGVEEKLPSQLSGGMRRRVGFARAIAHEPEILLFDEPTSGLDPITTGLIDDVILDLSDTLHSTTLTITHDMNSAFRIADQVALLDRGRIVAKAPPAEFQAHSDPRVQQFIHGLSEGPMTDPGDGAPAVAAARKG